MADDYADVTDMFREMADDQCRGLKITLAGNGKETIELLNVIPTPDAIILDIKYAVNERERLLVLHKK